MLKLSCRHMHWRQVAKNLVNQPVVSPVTCVNTQVYDIAFLGYYASAAVA